MQTKGIAIVGVAALLSAAVAGAQPSHGPGSPAGRMRHPAMMGRLARVLELTEEQKAAIKKQMEQQRPQRQALHAQMRDNRVKLKALLDGGNPDPAAVGQLTIQEHKLRQQAKAQREQDRQALRALLTPEQQAKFDLLESMKPGGGERAPGRMRHPGGPGLEPGGAAPEDEPEV
jgi:Spy/CpxP family protein refolding chaperone